MKNLFFCIFLFSNWNSFAQLPDQISDTEKIYGLSKFWQEVNYNFVYLDKVDRQAWDSLYRAYIQEVVQTENDYEYYRLLQKFCAFLGDGHTNVYFPKSVDSLLFNTYFGEYRFWLENIDDRAIVAWVNESKKEEIPPGSEVLQVNGMPTKKYMAKYVTPYISSSTDHILQNWSVNYLLKAPRGTSFQLQLKTPDGTIKNLNLTHTRTHEKEVYPPFPKWNLLDFKWLENDIAYVSLNSFGDEKIVELFKEQLPEIYKAKGLIVDLRKNGGGSTWVGRNILEYITQDKVLYGSKNMTREHLPAYKAWGKYTAPKDTVGNDWQTRSLLSYEDRWYHTFDYEGDTVRLDEKRIVVPTAILIGNNTASAAEDFLIYADNQKHIFKVGEKTFGSTGQPLMLELPGGGSARICTKKDTYPDGKEFVGVGVLPDVEIKPTLEEYLAEKDVALEKAIELVRKKINLKK